MNGDQERFENLIRNLLSSDNATRSDAEANYEGVHPTTKIPFLIQTMTGSTLTDEVRSMAAVLLRRLYTSNFEEFWPQFPIEAQSQLKVQMINSIQRETNPNIRKKICECVSEFARNLLDEDGSNQWPEFVKFLFECTLSSNIDMKESALIIFNIVPGIFGSEQNQHLDVIKQMFYQCISDQTNTKIRMLAARAVVAFILINETEPHVLNHLKDLLPAIIQCIAESIGGEDETLIKSLIDLADAVPKFLKSQLETIFNLCLKIVSDSNLGDQWRQLALEVIVTLAETSPGMVKRHQKLIASLIPEVLRLMTDLEDDPDWSFADEVENNDSDTNPVAGESALDRLACSLSGKTMLPHIISNIPPMLQDQNWKCRHAGLMAISACGEGCHTQMEEVLPNIVEAILPYLQDPHPQVRYATCNALGQMSTDFGPVFQKKFHQKVVPGLLMVMESNYNHPRVQAHAGAALINFSESCPKNLLTGYLEAIMNTLEQILNAKFKELVEKGTKLVLEQVVSTLASVADTAEENFEQYYDKFMPCLKYIFQNATNVELKLLRGKTIECISLIGLAVGRNKFMQDCSEVMELLLKTQTEWQELSDDDPQISYMISAWARICKIMGKDFEQYLPLVMGPVLKAASLKPEVAILDNEDMKSLENDNDWQFVTLGDQQSFGIRTAGLEEKATACQMLVCYARELKEGFAQYVPEVIPLMQSHLKFYFHDGVRLAAAESMPLLLECAKVNGPKYVLEVGNAICFDLLRAIESDPERSVKAEHMNSLAQCIELLGPGCLTNNFLEELVQILEKVLTQHIDRETTKQQQQQSDEDYDEERASEEDEEYAVILSRVSDVVHAVIGTLKESSLPFFDQLLPHFVKLLPPERPWTDHQWGICIFDDVLEYLGSASQKYSQYFLQPMLQYVTDKQAEVRQAAAYGIGVMAKHGGPAYSTTCADALPLLIRVIQDPNSRQPENACATENAISAVGKICKYNPGSINLSEVLTAWISWLPVWEDEEEAIHIYNYLCDLVESNNPVILGENNRNLPFLLKLFSETFSLNAILPASEVGKRIINIIRQLQGNNQIFQACLAHLTPELQNVLMSLLTFPQ